MVRYADWRDPFDPERPLDRLDPGLRIAGALLGGAIGLPCCFYGCVPGFVLGWRTADDALLLRRVGRLRDLPARFPQHACRVVLDCDGVVFGKDEGLVSLVDGTLLYEGRRTSFSLRRVGEQPAEWIDGLAFTYETPAGTCRARIMALRPKAVEFRDWLSATYVPEAQAVFPPFRPERRRLLASRTWPKALEVGGLVGMAVAGALCLLSYPTVALAVAIVVLAAFIALRSFALRVSRRLERLGAPLP